MRSSSVAMLSCCLDSVGKTGRRLKDDEGWELLMEDGDDMPFHVEMSRGWMEIG